MIKIRFTESAFNDLENIKFYYHDQGIQEHGNSIVNEILEHIELLKDFPGIGRIVPEYDIQNMRELIHPPFRIVYI